jgi:hypothetical protein
MKLLLLLFLLPSSAIASDIRFWKETIALEIMTPDTLTVKGTYLFTSKNGSAERYTLYYPFPLDSSMDYPSSVVVTSEDGLKTYPIMREKEGVDFTVQIPKTGACTTMVVYKQHVRHDKAKYILLTTHSWGEPLCDSHYSVTISPSLTLSYISYACDSIKPGNHGLTYYFYRDNFLPDKDFEVSWKKE